MPAVFRGLSSVSNPLACPSFTAAGERKSRNARSQNSLRERGRPLLGTAARSGVSLVTEVILFLNYYLQPFSKLT